MDISSVEASGGRAAAEGEPGAGALVPLTPAIFHILLALAGGERHGYGIMQAAGEISRGQVRLGAGTLYRSLQRMVVEGLIEEEGDDADVTPEDERRRNYRMTPLGREVAEHEARRLAALVGAARACGILPPPAGEATDGTEDPVDG